MFPNTLTVVIGAGASYECVSEGRTEIRVDYRPPLTSELFSARPSFNAILRKYPRVEALSDEIRAKLSSGTPLETLLRLFSEEENLILRKQYWEIPFYLQELLGEVSDHFVQAGTTKFSTLFRAILRSDFKRVLFLTLNYDTLLERAISGVTGHSFVDLSSYCPENEKWQLLKLHGSVNWGREIRNYSGKEKTATEVLTVLNELDLADEIRMLKGHQDDYRKVARNFFYPALAVPLDKEKQYISPPEHVECSRDFIRTCQAFLILGFSGLDADVLELLSVAEKPVRVKVVDKDRNAATEVLRRVAVRSPSFGQSPPVDLRNASFSGGFEAFVSSGEAERFLGFGR
jgi:hypothetical protein